MSWPEPFLLRACLAAICLAIIAAPLGCIIVWNRIAYFGETIAQAALLGIALGLAFQMDLTLAIFLAALAAATIVALLSLQKLVPLDSILGLMHHGALAAGVIAVALLSGRAVDLVGFLFGDIFAVSDRDLIAIAITGVIVLAALALLWQPLLRLAVDEELAIAEGVPVNTIKFAFMALLALLIAFAVKIVGVLLVIAFLIVPAVAARPLARTPELMALVAAAIGIFGVIIGLWISWTTDAPGGPAIVATLACIAIVSVAVSTVLRSNQ